MNYCPRGPGPNSPFKAPLNGEMEWRDDHTCSYCGSLSPDQLFKAIEDECKITPTDKNYKVYVDGQQVRGAGKFYFQHFSKEEQGRFIDLANAKKINMGTPGHFYVLPFFCQRVDNP